MVAVALVCCWLSDAGSVVVLVVPVVLVVLVGLVVVALVVAGEICPLTKKTPTMSEVCLQPIPNDQWPT